jgi:hypothetical protein
MTNDVYVTTLTCRDTPRRRRRQRRRRHDDDADGDETENYWR